MSSAGRSSLLTIAAIAICSYAACDMIHEVLGHGSASLFVSGARPLSLSTVALQTEGVSRIVAAAGAVANIIAGILALLFVRRAGCTTTRCFLLLLAALNLFNGTGYLPFSALTGSGDWAVVIAGCQPQMLWRIGMGLVGLASYVAVLYTVAAELAHLVRTGRLARSDTRRLVYVAYVTGGILFVAGAALNPIDPRLILISGVSSGFGAMAGLLFLPAIGENRNASPDHSGGHLPFSWPWVVTAIAVAVVFIGVIGPGIRL